MKKEGSKILADLLAKWNPAQNAVDEINEQVVQAESDLAALKKNAQEKNNKLGTTRSALRTVEGDENLILLGKQLESDKAAADQINKQAAQAESALEALKRDAQEKRVILDGIETSIKEIVDQGIEVLAAEFASFNTLKEERDTAVIRAETAETERDQALATPPIKEMERVPRDPTKKEIAIYLAQNPQVPSQDQLAKENELNGLRTLTESKEKLLAFIEENAVGKEAGAAYLAKHPTTFDPANITEEQFVKLLNGKEREATIAAFLLRSESAGVWEAYDALIPPASASITEKATNALHWLITDKKGGKK